MTLRLGQSQQLAQQQTTVMTETLQASLKLLQYSALELQETLRAESEVNPFLLYEDLPIETELSPTQPYFPNASRPYLFSSDEQILNNFSTPLTLKEHLRAQLPEVIQENLHYPIAEYLIDALEEDGYLRTPLDEMAGLLNVSASLLTSLLLTLQQLEPVGVFARNLEECLTLQLADKGLLTPAMRKLVMHLPLLAQGDLLRLSKIMEVDMPEVQQAITHLKRLNPKPGQYYLREQTDLLKPDLLVSKSSEGIWVVEINAETTPKVTLDKNMIALLRNTRLAKEEKHEITQTVQRAQQIMYGLEKRVRTLIAVGQAIVEEQQDFLEHGILYLKPMTLQHIAEKVELHVSTISRVVASKWIKTPRGTFNLKYFFTSSLDSARGSTEHSSLSIKHRIADLIAGEAPHAILSDEKICQLLQQYNIVIARRTVAKYREALNIPSAKDRRKSQLLTQSSS